MLKADVFAPIPRPSVRTAMSVNPGVRRSERNAKPTSFRMPPSASMSLSSPLRIRLPRPARETELAIRGPEPAADVIALPHKPLRPGPAAFDRGAACAPDTARSQYRDDAAS